jgi:hypothetical protein
MLMDQTDLVPELARGHLLNMCKDNDHWAFHHQCECKLDARTRLQDSGETRPRTLLALEELQEQHQEEVLVQELQERHRYIHRDKQCWPLFRPQWCRRASEALDQGLALGQKETEQELAGTAARVWQALLSAPRPKYQLREGSLVPRKCGKQLQGQVPAR